jgi:hypothetical protein
MASMSLFLEDIYDALRSSIQFMGGPKAVGARLWPHKPMDQAHREMLDCLYRDNRRNFDPEEIMALLKMAREAGFHQAKHWIDHELGYSPSDPVEPETELTKLLREYLSHEKQQEQRRTKIEEQRTKLQSVK